MDGLAPRIHNYRDYRDFLGDWFRAGKTTNAKLSFRYVAKHLGLRAPNHFQLVITKKRHLSKATLGRMQRLLKLRSKERAYLDLLFEHATEKLAARQAELSAKIERLNVELLDADVPQETYSLLSSSLAWYMKAGALHFHGLTLAEITSLVAKTCPFPGAEKDVPAALELLTHLKMARLDGETYVFDMENVTTDWDFDDGKIKQFHYNNLMLAMQAIPWPIDRRFFSNVTIPCNDEIYEIARKEIRDLYLRLMALSNSRVTNAEECQRVVSLQFAMFPYFAFGDRA